MLLTVLTLLPAIGALFVAVYPPQKPRETLWIALGFSLLTFAGSLWFFFLFDPGDGGFQFRLAAPFFWIPSLGVTFQVGLDGISILLYLLTTCICPLAILSADSHIRTHRQAFLALMLLLESAMLGAFAALDLFLFYVCWEAMLVPMYFIIGMWGGPRRAYATVKFFIFTMVGSLPMLLGILFVYFRYQEQFAPGPDGFSLDWANLARLRFTTEEQCILFAAFAISFAVKVPLFPLHTWLPDAHVEAPTAGSIVLAAILLKMGGYGFLRFGLPLFPEAAHLFRPVLVGLCLTGVIYGALVAMVQEDIKRLVAYSSVSHMALAMLGLFSMNLYGLQGGLYQMVSHGFATGALFLLVGVLYDRRHTRDLSQFGGLARVMPWYASAFLLIALASIGLPGTAGFVGEFLILLGAFHVNPWHAVAAGSGLVLGAWYMLRLIRHLFHGEIQREENRALTDFSRIELAMAAPFLAFVLLLGLWPQPFLVRTEASIRQLVQRLEAAKAGPAAPAAVHSAAARSEPPRCPAPGDTPAQGAHRSVIPVPEVPGADLAAAAPGAAPEPARQSTREVHP